MKNGSQLGINTIHVDVTKLKEFGLERAEVCLGRRDTYEESLKKANSEIKYLEKNKIVYSIHLPIYLYDWFSWDYLDAFFLDSNPEKREISFKLLDENLYELSNYNPDYFVLHFPGVYLKKYESEQNFNKILFDSLERINSLAEKYDKKILLEYFGSNTMFWDYKKWTEIIPNYKNLGILTDTGHLYYSSIINKFDFLDGLKILAEASEGFHLWTTKGNKAYGENEYYKKYHHIILNPEQKKDDDWAFDSGLVYKFISSKNRPMIIEASPYYGSDSYFFESIKKLVSFKCEKY